ncbi:MAG TPA: hypothetical protein DCX01_08085 [Bacteroidetes bacterium]|nr:hypothetical protein [Bacteroidota bacterium]
MENTSFNYQPRDPQAQINWAEAASNLGNVFKEEARVRTEKKAAIDEATRQYQKELAKGVPGESTSIREWGLNYAGDAQEQMDMITMMLKSGQMNVSDYTRNKQNLVDGTEEAFSLMDDYQKEYAIKMERLKSEDPANASQRLEAWVMENVEGFGNFNKTQLTIDPSTGKVMAAKKILNEKTGLMEISKDPNDLVPVSALKNNIISQFNKYDVEKSTKAWTANLGLIQSVSRTTGSRTRAGQILTVIGKIPAQYDKEGRRIMKKLTLDDAKELGFPEKAIGPLNDYIEAEDSWIDGQLSNPYNMTSVFTDYINETDGKSNSFTFNQEEAKENPNLILMKRDAGGTPIPVFDKSINPNAEKQKEEIRQYMKYAIRTKTSESSTIQTYKDYTAPTGAQLQLAEQRKLQKESAILWNKIATATSLQDKKDAVAAYLGTEYARAQGLQGLTFGKDGDTINFTYKDSSKSRNNVPVPQDKNGWADLGAEAHGMTGKAARAGFTGEYVDNPNFFIGAGSSRQGTTNYVVALNNQLQSETFNSSDEAAVNELASKYGGSVGKSSDPDDETVYVFNSKGKSIPYNGATNAAIKNHLRELDEEKAANLYKTNQPQGAAEAEADPLGIN